MLLFWTYGDVSSGLELAALFVHDGDVCVIRNPSVSTHNLFLARSDGQLSNFLKPSNSLPIWQRGLLEGNHMVLTGTREPSRLIIGI